MTETRGPSPLRKKIVFASRLALVFAVSAVPMMSESQRAAIAKAVRDPMALLTGRSPGERGNGALIPTKVKTPKLPSGNHLLSAAYVMPPGALTPQRPGVLAEETPGAPRPFGAPSGHHDVALGQGGPQSQSAGGPAGLGSPLSGGLSGGGGGGGGGRDPEGTQRPAGTDETGGKTPVNVVPEPATWAMLLAGFFLLGGLMRRGKIAHRPTSAAR